MTFLKILSASQSPFYQRVLESIWLVVCWPSWCWHKEFLFSLGHFQEFIEDQEAKERNLKWLYISTLFTNGPGDLGSIPGRVIPKTQKMVLDASLLNTQHYKVRIKGKVEPSREGVAPSPTSWCSSYRKGSLRVTLDYGRQLYFTYISENYPFVLFLICCLFYLYSIKCLVIFNKAIFGSVWLCFYRHMNLCGLFNDNAILVEE